VTTFAQRCNPPIPAREVETLIKSAHKSGTDKGPSTPGDALRNVVKKWERENRNYTTAAKATNGTPSRQPAPTEDTTETAPPSLRDQCIEIAGRGLSGSALEQSLIEAGQAHRVSLAAARDMFDAVCEEADRDESRGIVASEVTALERDLDASLDLHRILPAAIANEMYRWAEAANIKPEGLLMALSAMPLSALITHLGRGAIAAQSVTR